MDQNVARRIVIVTGGGSGIGLACANAFAADSHVVLVGRDESRLQAAAAAIGDGEHVAYHRADLTRAADVTRVVDAVVAAHGGIDVLVNNAGTSEVPGVTTTLPLDEAERRFDAELRANAKVAFLISVAAAPHLRRPGGRIVNIGSIAAHTGGSQPGCLGYGTAKAAQNGLTSALARELSPQGITVNAVIPGFITNTRFSLTWPSDLIDSFATETAVGRNGEPEDVAAAVHYLASPQARHITGELLSVNGGALFGR